MNRIVLAVLALGAAASGVYLLTRDSEPNPREPSGPVRTAETAEGSSTEPARREDLVNPNVAEADRQAAATQAGPATSAQEAAPKAGGGADPTTTKKEEQQGVPITVPADGEVDPAIFVQKYSAATGEERRLALESLTLLYKDAAAGRIKDGEKMLPGIQAELEWLDRNLDP